jgi:hypothetical protein
MTTLRSDLDDERGSRLKRAMSFSTKSVGPIAGSHPTRCSVLCPGPAFSAEFFADFRRFSPIFADLRRFSPIFADFRRFFTDFSPIFRQFFPPIFSTIFSPI